MNRCVLGWPMEDDNRSSRELLPLPNQKKSMEPESDLIELLWRNGHVVMHNQTPRKSPTIAPELKQAQKPDPLLKRIGSVGILSDLIQEDDTAPWFQYALDDSFEKELCSELFCVSAADADKLNNGATGESCVKYGSTVESNGFTGSASKHSDFSFQENMMPPPKSHFSGSNQQPLTFRNGGGVNFANFRPAKPDLRFLNEELVQKGSGNGGKLGIGESYSTTIGSSACGSNQVPYQVEGSYALSNNATGAQARGINGDAVTRMPAHEGVQINNYKAAATSSSGGSGSSFGRTGHQSISNLSSKRKGRDGDESESRSEEAEYESAEANKRAQKSASARRSRAAEVHNLSERKRRDRINEKMRALQELIPHCNKSDKASMLDEAIEYLKSLQLQVQIMWMGSGMGPMMFPGVQQYMSRMSMGMAHGFMPSVHSPIQLPKVPLVGQSIPSAPAANHTSICSSQDLSQANLPSQMQNAHFSEPYPSYLGFPHMQLPPQAMNLYPYGSHAVQNNQPAAAAVSSGLPLAGTFPSEIIQNGQPG